MAVGAAAAQNRPDVIADLGGGTGFLLAELNRRRLAPGCRLINVDASAAQLQSATSPALHKICAAVGEVCRNALAADGQRLLFLMRSVLHYFGAAGLAPALRHLRAQQQPGEYFVHQTACFAEPRAADDMNRLYALMATGKWYPTRAHLEAQLAEAGWRVTATAAAPALPLDSAALAERYRLTPAQLSKIQSELPEALETTPDGFRAWLPYTIFTCAAV